MKSQKEDDPARDSATVAKDYGHYIIPKHAVAVYIINEAKDRLGRRTQSRASKSHVVYSQEYRYSGRQKPSASHT